MQTSNKLQDFTHPILGQEITAIGGHYVFNKEDRLKVESREVVYLVGYAVVDTSCCGLGGCAYAMVPGIVREWKYRKDDDGLPVSQVEPVLDPDKQHEIQRRIQEKEMVQQVTFGF